MDDAFVVELDGQHGAFGRAAQDGNLYEQICPEGFAVLQALRVPEPARDAMRNPARFLSVVLRHRGIA